MKLIINVEEMNEGEGRRSGRRQYDAKGVLDKKMRSDKWMPE
jgi:hypothetical protein